MPQPAPPRKADGFVRTFATIGVLSFGGPAGQIAVMHRELVEKRRWLDEASFLAALNVCLLLPGPEAQQLAIWLGWRRRGVSGGLIAGLLFIAPGALVMAGLASLYIGFGQVAAVQAVFAGVQAAVIAIVAQAVWRVARRALTSARAWWLAGAAFVLINLFAVPFPLVVALATVVGAPAALPSLATSGTATPVPWRASLRTALLWLLIWLLPLAGLALWLGPDHGLVALGSAFARLALSSFGGAYAGLAYVAQGASGGPLAALVTPREIVDGLALAETTPGPLVLVYQFVGGIAGHRLAGPWPAFGGAIIGMALVLWMTFAPSFLFVFTLAPHFDRVIAQPRLARALSGVTAAVVGVMASLGVWFALHVLFVGVQVIHYGPVQLNVPQATLNPFAAATALVALILLTRTRLGMIPVLVLAGATGLARQMLA